jgi:hypothetical protein
MAEFEDPLLTTLEAAGNLNCSGSFLAKERMRGTGPEFIRIGRAIRYSRSALDAYKAANTRVSTSEYDVPRGAHDALKSNRRTRPKCPEGVSTSIHRHISRSTSHLED